MTTETREDNADEDRDPAMTTSIDHDGDTLAVEEMETAAEGDDATAQSPVAPPKVPRREVDWSRVLAYGIIPALALLLFAGAGYLKWWDTTIRDEQAARTQSVQTARDSTIALLSYTPADVDQKLTAARGLLTGQFRDAYTSLTEQVVIPGAKQQQITAVASVPAASSVSASVNHAVVLVFVNQTTTIGSSAPTDLASTVRVTMDKVDGHWLISLFDPV